MTGSAPKRGPLCVDLDGTVLKTDAFLESVFLFCKRYPLEIVKFPVWLKGGKAYFKRQIAERIDLEPEGLPFNEEVIAYVRGRKEAGDKIVLATAADEIVAKRIAEHLGLFDEIVASDGEHNLDGSNKAKALTERYGKFGYIGNEKKDIKIWQEADEVLLVSSCGKLRKEVEGQFSPTEVFEGGQNKPRDIFRAIRVHQWVKNLLLFVPLIMAHEAQNPTALFSVALGFVSFCLCASSVYLINDLLDLDADRQHPTKSKRPLAAGSVSVIRALAIIPLLLLLSVALSFALPVAFQALLGGYFLATLAYSLFLKQVALVDILTLAGLFTVRVVAGGLSASIPVSEWLMAFSMFIFLSLACAKRYAELFDLRKKGKESVAGRGYEANDLELVGQLGTSAGYISVLVLALYINSGQVTTLYSSPVSLWLVCPFLLYWISRVWLLAHRGDLNEDPIVFAIRDRVSYIVGAFCLLVVWLAV